MASKLVLIVEDEPDNREIIRTVVEDIIGHEAALAADGESALVSISQDDTTKTGRLSALRMRLPTDTIEFADTFLLDVEYGANRPTTALDYSSVALFYSK